MYQYLTLVFLFVFMATESNAQSQTTNLPIKKVQLYSSGVGYFEHEGRVEGASTTELRFRAAQMNDVLKSLLLQDLDGGRINSIVYPSQDPVDKILGSFDIDLGNNPSLGNVLTQLRGSAVTIRSGTDVHRGVILGVESKVINTQGGAASEDVVNLIKQGTITSLRLSQVDAIEIEDEALQEEFNKALQAVAQARDQDKKPLLIAHEGNGRRRVRVGYVVESPVWKTSYRLVLPEEGEKEGYLQGWSIVENQTENDWENIELTLISGRPISFIQDLYNPLYVQRPVVAFELQENLMPQMYERGMDLPMDMEADAMEEAVVGRSRAKRSTISNMPPPPAAAPTLQASMGGSVQTAAQTAEAGELFQYIIGSVSLPRQRSAMIPIVTESVDMQKVSIFNANVQPRHPLHGVRITNSTDIHLMQGPATVLDAGSYAGDARLNELPSDSKQLLSYALDFEMQVDVVSSNEPMTIQSAKIVNGVLESQRKRQHKTTYTLKNESEKARSVIIEHPRKTQWTLLDTDEPMETTDQYHRFQVDAAESKQTAFTVMEEQISSQAIQLTSLDVNALSVYTRGGAVSSDVRRALQKAISLKQQVQQSDQQIRQKEQQIKNIAAEQGRIRENMGTVERSSSYYKRLLGKLEAQENDIDKMGKEIDGLRKSRDKDQQELVEFLRGLNVN
ncbi:MAG: hypothetical protein AAF564_08925 [Bacteroidota bacterium]